MLLFYIASLHVCSIGFLDILKYIFLFLWQRYNHVPVTSLCVVQYVSWKCIMLISFFMPFFFCINCLHMDDLMHDSSFYNNHRPILALISINSTVIYPVFVYMCNIWHVSSQHKRNWIHCVFPKTKFQYSLFWRFAIIHNVHSIIILTALTQIWSHHCSPLIYIVFCLILGLFTCIDLSIIKFFWCCPSSSHVFSHSFINNSMIP